jgi:hypothetical protein
MSNGACSVGTALLRLIPPSKKMCHAVATVYVDLERVKPLINV